MNHQEKVITKAKNELSQIVPLTQDKDSMTKQQRRQVKRNEKYLTNHVPLKDRQFEILQKKEDKLDKLKAEQAKRDYLKDPENFDPKF